MDPIRNFVSPLERSDISNGVNKRIIKKSICLVTVWVFILSQFVYAGFEDFPGLPPTEPRMPIWTGYQQTEPTLPPSNSEEGGAGSTGIWDWLVRNAGPALETVAKTILALFPPACSAPHQVTPTPTPEMPTTYFELPTKLGEYDRLNVSVDLNLTDLTTGPLIIKTPSSSVPISFYNNLQFSEGLSAYLEAERNHGKEVTPIAIYNAQLTLDEQGSLLVVAKGNIELRGKEGLKNILTMAASERVKGTVRNINLQTYPGTYREAIGYIEDGSLVGIIGTNGEFTWGLHV